MEEEQDLSQLEEFLKFNKIMLLRLELRLDLE